MQPLRIGVIGCGNISTAYIKASRDYPGIQITALADLIPEVARQRASELGVPRVLSVDDLLADPQIDCVLNLTIPKAHTEVSLRALEAGKHVYSEKPLGVDREEGRKVIELARRKGLRVGCAPDTFFGAGHQTARKLIDDGMIGRPVAATAFMLCPGHERWHPNPEFFYEPGGGPMLDMGPYYVTALINMFGPIRRVTGMASIAISPRTITHKAKDGSPGPKFGKTIDVKTPDHITGCIEFESGVIATVITSFATWHGTYDGKHPITVYGTEGTLAVPDPNAFDGDVKLRKAADADWQAVAHTHPKGYLRSIGMADMADAIANNRPHRASGDLAFAALDAMLAFTDSSRTGQAVQMSTKADRPAPLPAGSAFGTFA